MDKKNILTEHTFRNNTFLCQIRERIENRKECLDYFAACLKHQEISDKVSKEFYYDKPITSFILNSGLSGESLSALQLPKYSLIIFFT